MVLVQYPKAPYATSGVKRPPWGRGAPTLTPDGGGLENAWFSALPSKAITRRAGVSLTCWDVRTLAPRLCSLLGKAAPVSRHLLDPVQC